MSEERTFTDMQGRQWTLSATLRTVLRVKEEAEVDLLELVDKADGMYKVAADPSRFVQVLGIVLEDQLKERELSVEDLMAGLDGDAVEQAALAMMFAVIEYQPKEKRTFLRDAFRKTVAKVRENQQQQTELALKELDNLDFTALTEEAKAEA